MTNRVHIEIIFFPFVVLKINKKYKPVTDKEEYPLVQENHLESTENKNKHHRKLKAAKCFKNIVSHTLTAH